MERAGFTGILSKFLKASFSAASPHIILNGRPTRAFRLARSVRQGCPLSPLIFILTFDNLSLVLAEAVTQRTLMGVRFPHLGISNLLTMFADDTSMVIKAEMRYVRKVQEILDIFGKASGLKCIWEKTKAAFIPAGPPPSPFDGLPWTWEVDTTATKLLGFPTASDISAAQLENQVQLRMSTSIAKLQQRQLSLAGRVVAANSLILGSIWYLLTLWAGDLSFLAKLQRTLESFVWVGRARVNRNTMTQSRAKGGLGLMLIIEQYRALAGNLMIWALGPGSHPLRRILRSHLTELSRSSWGYPDFTWVVTMGGSKRSCGSSVWQNICIAWSSLKHLLVRIPPRNLEEWGSLPIWSPHLAHITPKLVRCKTQAQHRLRTEGLLTINDISSHRGELLAWPEVAHNVLDTAGHRAFDTLISNLHAAPQFPASLKHQSIFFEADRTNPDSVACVWQFSVPESEASSSWHNIVPRFAPIREFSVCAGNLRARLGMPSAIPIFAHRILVRSPTKKAQSLVHWGRGGSDCGFLSQHGWQDGTALLDTSTTQLSSLQARLRQTPHTASLKWETDLGQPIPENLWTSIWLPYRGSSENTFLWQLFYRVIATQHWRMPSKPPTDPDVWCTRCNLGIMEDTEHCIWSCPISATC